MYEDDDREPRPQRPASSGPTAPMMGTPADFAHLLPLPPTEAERAVFAKFVAKLLRGDIEPAGGAL